jgi:hypothetical protein
MTTSQLLAARLQQLTKNTEMFLMESPYNNYQPRPPEGCFAMRSHKRRIFMPLLNGRIPPSDLVQERIKLGEYHVA